MGITVLPNNFLKRMDPKDRQALGKAGQTAAEANQAHAVRVERDLHNQIMDWLNLNDLYFIRARMDKKSTISKGAPDFFIVLPGGKVLPVEMKLPGGTTTPDQDEHHLRYMRQVRRPVYVARSLEEVRNLVDTYSDDRQPV